MDGSRLDETLSAATPSIPELQLHAPGTPVDLTNCDLEPIHIPSSIQPHGVLLAARASDHRIVYISANSAELLGAPPAFLLERTLTEVIGVQALTAIENALGDEQYLPTNILTYSFPFAGEARFDVVAHRSGGLLCMELELGSGTRRWDVLSMSIELAIRDLRRPTTLAGLCEAFAPLIRGITGYDRVMVYQFDYEGNGEVVAEARDPDMEPFLGLHYPASDIPAQARRLYLLQRVRTIVDVNYTPVPLLANPVLMQNQPLDMTYCGLRSISPIHIEYLQNMGVGATLSMSLVHRDRLWGMVLCHHRSARRPALETRALADQLSQLMSLLIGKTLEAHHYAERLEKQALLQQIGTAVQASEQMQANLKFPIGDQPQIGIESVVAQHGDTLLALTGADGAVIRVGGRIDLIGSTPALADALALMSALRASLVDGITATDSVGADLPALAPLADMASGALMVQFHAPDDCIVWFRGEAARSVHWAGNPNSGKVTVVSEGDIRMSPRKSFALWEQIHLGRSLPWLEVEMEAARDLRPVVVKALLERTEAVLLERRRLARELADAHERLNSVLDSTSEMIVEIDTEWVIVYGNRRAAETLVDFHPGTSFWTCFSALAGTRAERTLRAAMQDRVEVEYEVFDASFSQSYRVHVFPTQEGISLFMENITAEQTLRERLTLEQLLREKRIEALSHMAGGLAHEISNPLAIIHGRAADLQRLAEMEAPVPALAIREACDSIMRTSDRATRILRGLRGFAREGKHDPLEFASLPEIVDEALELQQARFATARIGITLQLDTGIPLLYCNSTQVGQILTNLLNNAFDAVSHAAVLSARTDGSGEIGWTTLTATRVDDDIRIDVCDSGPGVEDHFKAHLMEPFFTTKELGLGMGVGLSLSRAIAQNHGGSLTMLDGTPHTCFRLVLPIHARTDDAGPIDAGPIEVSDES
jgi:light-regulated signal transduction histidine kinase (bacteriophytochrome)